MKASEFDKKFEAGKDITQFLDLKKATRSGLEVKRYSALKTAISTGLGNLLQMIQR